METHHVLVTGCSGFLGPYVVDELAGEGHEVVGFDLVEPKFSIGTFFKGDLTERTQLEPALAGISAVCHLGGVGDVYLAERDASLAFRANALATKTVCEACVHDGIEKLVFASTWEVYGKPIRTPVDEEHPCNPETSYSISKLAAELFVRASDGRNGIETLALRLGTAYGPLMRETAVIARFVRQALAGKPLTVQGDGSQSRQFTHGVDIGRAFAAALSHSARERVYNVASEEVLTILEIARMISERSGASIEFTPSRSFEPASVRVSCERALRDLQWHQTIRIEDGLQRLLTMLDPTDTKRTFTKN